jgi:hypothetical protein
MKRTSWLLALALASSAALAQAPAPAAKPAPAPSSPAKKALVARILQIQQPGIENLARQLAEQPALQMLQQAGVALQQRVPADKRQEVAQGMQADARKYSEEATPLVRERAIKLLPSTIGPLLEERFTEDELKQLATFLESPVNKKYQQLGPDMLKAIGEKVVTETKPQIEPKVKALEQQLMKRLEAGIAAGAASAPK